MRFERAMDVLLIRHAPAEDREQFARTGQPDELRPLTPRGIERMQLAARGLVTLALPIERLVTSPLVRAQQTAQIVAPALEIREFDAEAMLSPQVPTDSLIDWLRKQPRVDGLALIGHEPDLGYLAETLLCGSANGCMPLKKGGATLLRFAEGVAARQGQLIWSLTPGILRTLAD